MKDEGSIKAALSDSQAATACNRWTQQMDAPAGQQGSDHHTAYSVRSSIERPAPRSAQEPPQLETIDVACTFNRRLCMYRLLAIFHPSRFGLMRVRFQQPQAEAQQVLMVGTSDPAYPAYLFSCWADLAQDPYKRSLSRAVRKRKEVASAVEQEPEVAHFDADCCISNAAVRIMGSLGNRIPSGRKRFFDKVGWILPAVPLSKREAEDDFKTDRAAFKKASAVRTFLPRP